MDAHKPTANAHACAHAHAHIHRPSANTLHVREVGDTPRHTHAHTLSHSHTRTQAHIGSDTHSVLKAILTEGS